MGREVTRFVGHEYRSDRFEEMLREISAKAAVSPELVRKYAEKALGNWEDQTGKDMLTLFTVNPNIRSEEITKMLENFRDYLRPIVFSTKKLNQTMHIAEETLETMYHIF